MADIDPKAEIDPGAAWRKLVRKPHFWIMLGVQMLTAGIAVGLVPDTGRVHQIVAGIMLVFQQYGYTAGAMWTPPRRPWSPEERIAKGLAPQPPSERRQLEQ